ncbi:hypothetical protein AXG93_626s1110 [Marchantia polymorpha subsp. ruderalis]|uniref:Uncharacterized protein n=1 Tax=Marchantia polymorpha subsp. ruderalis TaxID=1480154 RepID=A0A176W238_MARPO|nr:hypothetical protein AXG93_626s1110 [Marchantia polymorpha subsp. ruderalis]
MLACCSLIGGSHANPAAVKAASTIRNDRASKIEASDQAGSWQPELPHEVQPALKSRHRSECWRMCAQTVEFWTLVTNRSPAHNFSGMLSRSLGSDLIFGWGRTRTGCRGRRDGGDYGIGQRLDGALVRASRTDIRFFVEVVTGHRSVDCAAQAPGPEPEEVPLRVQRVERSVRVMGISNLGFPQTWEAGSAVHGAMSSQSLRHRQSLLGAVPSRIWRR